MANSKFVKTVEELRSYLSSLAIDDSTIICVNSNAEEDRGIHLEFDDYDPDEPYLWVTTLE